MPVGGTVGYELLDDANPFTTSDFLANVNLRRAVEGELARTIGTLRRRPLRRASIVAPERSLVRPRRGGAHRIDRPGPARGGAAGQAPDRRHPPAGRGRGPGLEARGRHAGRRRRQSPGRALGTGRRPAGLGRCRGVSGGAGEPAARQDRPAAGALRRPRQGGRGGQCRPRLRRAGDHCRAVRPAEPGRAQHADHGGGHRPEGKPAGRRRGCRRQPADGAGRDPAAVRPAAASGTTRPRRPSTTRSRAPSATRPSAAPRCAACRSRSRSTASTAQPDGTGRPTSRAAPRSSRSWRPWSAVPPASTRAAATWSRSSAASLRRRRRRSSRSPRRAGRRRLTARLRPVRRARRAQPAHPAGPVLRRAAGASPRVRGRPARHRTQLDRGRPGCRRQAAARARGHGRHHRRRSRRQSGGRAGGRSGRGRGRRGSGKARPASRAAELVALKNVRGAVQASLLGEVARAIEANPDDAVRVVRGWLHGGRARP